MVTGELRNLGKVAGQMYGQRDSLSLLLDTMGHWEAPGTNSATPLPRHS